MRTEAGRVHEFFALTTMQCGCHQFRTMDSRRGFLPHKTFYGIAPVDLLVKVSFDQLAFPTGECLFGTLSVELHVHFAAAIRLG